MTRQLTLTLVFSISLFWLNMMAVSTDAVPAVWEADFGGVLAGLSGQDDSQQDVSLSFAFPFFGENYSEIAVNTNGIIALGTGARQHYAMEGVNDFMASPIIAPFWTDLSLVLTGNVHFNDLGD